jgi:NADH-quinone oxidoreductase subunit G
MPESGVAPQTDAAPEAGGVPFVLDGRPVTAEPGELVISAAERAGVYIPRFCYHPRMKPVGMCRMCLVEVGGPRGPSLQPACFIEVAEGMEVTTTSEKVAKAQDGVLEFLLVNHPLDCPVCDKGGECPLQDQTLAYGPGESRFVEEKRHFEKPIAISELVLLDRERCIQCARCTRFAEEVAGEAQIDFAGRGEAVEVATFPGQPFSSYFSGNTVQICPVGALTATPYRFTARPWDLDQVESTCTTCALGCRVAVQSSANRLTRLLGIDSDPVNHGWLCDKGRFAFEAVNGDELADRVDFTAAGQSHDHVAGAVDVVPATAAQVEPLEVSRGQFAGEVHESGVLGRTRLTDPLVRKDGELVAVSWGEALAAAAEGLSAARDAGPGSVALLGGARCTNEAAYAWSKLARTALHTDSVDAQLGDGLPAELVLSLPRATIDQACAASTVILLTGDVREELPVLFLRLRQAALEGRTALLELSPGRTSLTPYAQVHLALRPGDGPALARALTGDDGAAAGLRSHPEGPAWSDDDLAAARRLVAGQGGSGDGTGVVVVLGRASVAESAAVTAEAARVLAQALPGARFLPALRRGNVLGALDMGLAPGILPGRVTGPAAQAWFAEAWGPLPDGPGRDATGALASLAGDDPGGSGPVRALVLLGAEVLADFPDRQLAERALTAADFVVAVTGSWSSTLGHADVVLPAAVAHERSGTTTNIEGRVTRLGQKLVAPGSAWSDWMIAVELAAALGTDLQVTSAGQLWDEIERLAPAYAGLTATVLDRARAQDGLVVPLDGSGGPGALRPIDPMALPGVESAERQGAPPRVGLTEPPPFEELAPVPALDRPAAPGPTERPPVMAGLGSAEPVHVAPPDSYSLRLVSGHRLYDSGAAVAGSPSLAALVPTAVVRANPYDLDRLGVHTGDPVRVRTARRSLVLGARADDGLPKGVVAVDFNLPVGPDDPTNAAAQLIDAAQPVTDVRLESV